MGVREALEGLSGSVPSDQIAVMQLNAREKRDLLARGIRQLSPSTLSVQVYFQPFSYDTGRCAFDTGLTQCGSDCRILCWTSSDKPVWSKILAGPQAPSFLGAKWAPDSAAMCCLHGVHCQLDMS